MGGTESSPAPCVLLARVPGPTRWFLGFFFVCLFLLVPGIKLMISHLLGRHCDNELFFQPNFYNF